MCPGSISLSVYAMSGNKSTADGMTASGTSRRRIPPVNPDHRSMLGRYRIRIPNAVSDTPSPKFYRDHYNTAPSLYGSVPAIPEDIEINEFCVNSSRGKRGRRDDPGPLVGPASPNGNNAPAQHDGAGLALRSAAGRCGGCRRRLAPGDGIVRPANPVLSQRVLPCLIRCRDRLSFSVGVDSAFRRLGHVRLVTGRRHRHRPGGAEIRP